MKDTLDFYAVAEKILYTIGIVTAFWKFTDAFFAYLHKRQKGFLTDLIDEKLKTELAGLKSDMHEMKEQREKDNRYQNEMMQKILSEVRK